MRTHTIGGIKGTDAETEHAARQQSRSQDELQVFSTTTVRVEHTTRGIRLHAKIPPTSKASKGTSNFKGVWTPGTYNSMDEVVVQSGAGQGEYICLADGNTNAPTTGIDWIQVSSLNQWF